ncbi:hypothetical protein I4U23_017814 [Adineta vaga]|nr:hypothetical protein I4U23_017814 [Adineta vaga]
MGVVGSLPSPTVSKDATNYTNVRSNLSTDRSTCSDEIIDDVNIKVDCSSDVNKPKRKKSSRRVKSSTSVMVMYGPINIKVRQSAAPTLATGRCSKFVELQGDAAVKREIRRKRNREAAKKLKEKRANIEDDLTQQISDYETKEKDLLVTIENLKAYKECLETQCRQIISLQESFARSAFRKVEQNRLYLHQSVPIHHNTMRIKEEPRPSSPQWQLLFSI